jgi:hypothetical protein
MGRPAGSKNKKTEVVENDVIPQVSEQKEIEVISHEEERKEPAKAVQVKPKLEPLGPGQRYFEAPTGEILIRKFPIYSHY